MSACVYELTTLSIAGPMPDGFSRRFCGDNNVALEMVKAILTKLRPHRTDVSVLLGRVDLKTGYRAEGIWVSDGKMWQRRL